LGQDDVNARRLSQPVKGWLIVSNSYDRNGRIFLRQLFEDAAQFCINGKDQDADHEYRNCPRGRLSYGTLAKDDLERCRRATAYQGKVHGAANTFGTQQMQDIAYALNRLTVPASDNVTYKQPRALGGPLGINIDEQNATSGARRW
jgi:hypothetical protein